MVLVLLTILTSQMVYLVKTIVKCNELYQIDDKKLLTNYVQTN